MFSTPYYGSNDLTERCPKTGKQAGMTRIHINLDRLVRQMRTNFLGTRSPALPPDPVEVDEPPAQRRAG